jgi:hypothetical protein
MGGDITFSTTTGILAANGEHVSAVTAPISSDVGYGFESVRNAVIDFLFISVLKCA